MSSKLKSKRVSLLSLIGLIFGVSGDFPGADVYNKIVNSHNPLIPPGLNVSVGMGLDVLQIIGIDMKTQQMTTRINLNMFWKDETLSWSKTQFPRIDGVTLPSSKVWTPSILLWNSMDEDFGVGMKGGDLYVSPEGFVQWSIWRTVKSSCQIDVSYYPFDQQDCMLKFGPTDNSVQLYLQNNIKHASFGHYSISGEWMVLESPAYFNVFKIEGANAVQSDVTFYLKFVRKTKWEAEVLPILTLALLTFLPFLASQFWEKLGLQLFVLAGLGCLYKSRLEILPPTRIVIPHVIKYLICLIALNLVHLTLTCMLRKYGDWVFEKVAKRLPRRVAAIIDMCCKTTAGDRKPTQNDIEVNDHMVVASAEYTGMENKGLAGNIRALAQVLIFAVVFVGVLASTLCFLLNHPNQAFDLSSEVEEAIIRMLS